MRAIAAAGVATLLTMGPTTAFGATINGGSGDDVIVGTASDDTINGGDGNDIIHGDAGNDTINGGNDNDHLFGDNGNDTINGGDGNDTLNGDNGDDTLFGDNGNDTINGLDGDDSLNGNAGNDTLNGGPGDDTLNGGPGDDTIYGGGRVDGNDIAHGGAGNDSIHGSSGADVLHGDEGDDDLHGDRGDDVLYGGDGDDSLDGGEGNDVLCGQAGTDTLNGQGGTDIACAVDDEIAAGNGVAGTRNLAANDEHLDDEASETNPLQYALVGSLPPGILATLNPDTGVLSYTATRSGALTYLVYRAFQIIDGPSGQVESLAQITITVSPADTVSPTDPKPVSKQPTTPVNTAAVGVLPNAGASSDPRVLVTGGIAALIAGTVLISAGARPQRRHTT